MARRQHQAHDVYDSDTSYAPDEDDPLNDDVIGDGDNIHDYDIASLASNDDDEVLSDVNYQSGSDTEVADIDDDDGVLFDADDKDAPPDEEVYIDEDLFSDNDPDSDEDSCCSDSYTSFASGDRDGLFDGCDRYASGTIGDSNDDDFGFDEGDKDIEDQLQLFGGNVYPPEYYRRAVEEFNASPFENEDYSEGTDKLLDSVEAQWDLYCNVLYNNHCDPKQCLRRISIGLLYNFFKWILNQKTGKGGRRKRGITKSSSLGTYWKVFRLVYEREVQEKIEPKMTRSMHKVLRKLAIEHDLSNQRRTNRCMTIDGLKDQIKETLNTTKKSFKLGELRMYAVLFLLLLAPAGARPTSILRLRFKDLRLVKARDPDGGPHNILIWFTLDFTKTYLGEKDAHSFPIPEYLADECLLLSLHVYLLGILFRHRAFRAPSLTSPEQLDKLDIYPDELELPLPLKKELDETYIFRRAVEELTGYKLSPNEPITYGMMAAWIKRIGEILGLEYATIPYNLRYNAANEWDQSGDISDALRNLAMDHASSVPIQKHYLGRNISQDLWGAIRKLPLQNALIKQSASISHSKSSRRPIGLTTEQTASVVTHPLIRQMMRHIRELRPGSEEYKEARRQLRNEKQRLRRELKHKIREEWTAKQAVDDIERQLFGLGFAGAVAVDNCRPQRPGQKRLLKALLAPLGSTLEEHRRRRNDAINAISAYCLVQEGCTPRQPKSKSTGSGCSTTKDGSAACPALADKVVSAILSVFVQNEKQRPRRCFVCVGNALSLPPDDPQVDVLIHEFYTSGDLSKHFRRKHLSKLEPKNSTDCKACDMPLRDKQHVKDHARWVHGTVCN